MELQEFSRMVGKMVQNEYGLDDGAGLCYNLVESGVIKMEDGTANAARQVAQHMEQA
jgi:hypothetical protein